MNLSIGKIINYQLALLYFFASWTNAFALSGILLVPVLIVAIIFLNWVLDSIFIQDSMSLQFNIADYFAILFVLVSLYSAILNSNIKTSGYVFAYCFSFIFLNIVLRNIIENYGNSDAINEINLFAIIFISCFILFDFTANVFFNFEIQHYLHRSVKADALYYILPRSYGFSEEPTYLAWYLNTLGTVALFFMWNKKNLPIILKGLCSILVLIGWLLTFSTAGIALLVIAFFLALSIKLFYDNFSIFIKRATLYRVLLFILLILIPLVIIVFIFLDFDFLKQFFSGFVEKITLSQGHSGDRQNVWANDLSIAMQQPLLGYGMGYMSSRDMISSLNLFIFSFYENGFLATSCLILFYTYVGLDILYSDIKGKLIFLTAYIAGVMHLMTMTQHYHPNLWLLLGLFYLLRKESNEEKVDK